MYEYKNIQVSYTETGLLTYTMNESLATTLVSNLLKNAFIHNIEKRNNRHYSNLPYINCCQQLRQSETE